MENYTCNCLLRVNLGVNTEVDQIPFYLKILFYTSGTCVKYGVCGWSVPLRISRGEGKLNNTRLAIQLNRKFRFCLTIYS